MKKLNGFFLLSIFLFPLGMMAQEDTTVQVVDTLVTDTTLQVVDTTTLMVTTDSMVAKSEYSAWTTPVISDDMTVDPEQNRLWKEGKAKFPAKPKNMWELGIHFGHFMLDGDVDRTIPAGYGVGLHLRKALHYVFSIRLDAFYGQAWGIDPQPWRHSSQGGGLVEDVFSPYGDPQVDGVWFPSHKTTYIYGAVEAILNIGNLLFHKERNKWNWYLGVGAGLDHHKAMLDLFDENGNPYNNLIGQTGYTEDLFNTRSGRLDIKDNLRNVYDGDYETEGYKKAGIFRLGDETNIHFVWIASMGISRKLGKRINIGLEHQVMLSDNDYLDGIKFRTSGDQTNNVDVGHYTHLRLGINLGSFSKRAEPLYWLNPLDAAFNDIAELKKRPIFDPTDTDGDGVIDILDEEPESPVGAPVDTKGRVLDSDGDGVADYQDQEPYSPGGYAVDENGVADVPEIPIWTREDIEGLVDSKYGVTMANCCRDWFLPMIHFDLDSYCIKPEYYPHLHHIATVMQSNPNVEVTVRGHTDQKNNNEYNMVLSYNRAKAAIDFLTTKYGLSRDRFNLMYGGEDTPLVSAEDTKKLKERQQYLNRRVEFSVAKDSDYDMPRPEGPEAGHCDEYKPSGDTYSPAPSSPVYRGNKNAGF